MYEIVTWFYEIVDELLCHWIFNYMIEWWAIWERQDVLNSHMILRDSRIYPVTEYSTVQFLIFLFLSYFLIFLTKLFCFLQNHFLSSFLFLISYISKMKIKSSNARIWTYNLCIWQIWVCEILIDWIYWIQKDSFIFDLWRNLFKERDDETEIESEIEYVISRKTRCLWLCDICSFSLSL